MGFQALQGKERLQAAVDDVEAKMVELAQKSKADLHTAVDDAKTLADTRCKELAHELDDLQKQNNDLARAVERTTKAKCAAEEEALKVRINQFN